MITSSHPKSILLFLCSYYLYIFVFDILGIQHVIIEFRKNKILEN